MTTRSALFLFLAAAPLHAQVLGELKGRLTGPSGAPIAGAAVELTEAGTGVRQAGTTTGAGEYDFAHLNSGGYALAVTAQGFQRLERSGITVTTGVTVGLDLVLQVGSAGETVTVTADAPLLQNQSSDVQTTIPGSAVEALPLNTRNYIQLTQLVPGVELQPGTLLPRINGGRPRTNEYLYDGISALQPEPGQVAFFPILDSIAEFTVLANNVPAEFGRFNGGVVNVATRSGTNDLHGSVFEYFRNEALNSRNYFAPANAPKPEYRRNLFGATLGAPILRDRLFVFADYQGTLQRVGVTRISTVPTVPQRRGIFTGTRIYDPATTRVVNGRIVRTEFPNEVINRPFDPTAAALLQRYPLPTAPGATNNYSRTANDDDHQQQFDLRVDAARGTRDRGFARYSYYSENENPVTPLPDGSGLITGTVIGTGSVAGLTNILGQQVVANETHTFTPSLVNDFRIGYTRRGNTQSGATVPNAPLVPGTPVNAAFNNALPLFTLTGIQQLGPSASTFSRYQTAVGELVDSVLLNRGAHDARFGVDFRRYELNAIAPPNPAGAFTFATTGTNTQATGASTGGNSIASFLLGQVSAYSIDLQTRTLRPRDYIYEFFAQDDWRVLPRLTLNLGARWTLHLPSTETHNQGAVFNLATQQLDYLGVNGFPRSARELHWGNVAPRLGLAFSPDTKTVIRSGFGIVFIDQSGITTPFTNPQYPFIQNVQQTTQDSFNPAFTLSSGPTVQRVAPTPNAGLGQSVYTVNRSAGSGYVEQWNLAVERSLNRNLSFSVTYVGSHVVHVGIPDADYNQLTAAQLAMGLTNPAALTAQVANPYFGQIPASSSIGGRTVAAAQLLRPYPRFQNVSIYRNNSGTSNYNAIEAKVERRMSRSLYFLFAYTHSKLIDDASSVFSSTVLSSPNSSSLIAADAYRPGLERDASNGDAPNILSFSAVYALPRFAGHGLATAALGGWNLNTLLAFDSGLPVTVTQANNLNAFAGVSLQRPNLVGKPNLDPGVRTPAHFFNTAAFLQAPQFTFGSASRNPARGPAYRDWDFALIKHTAVSEKLDVELRAELFNATNTPAFAQPNGTQGSAAFGSITSTVTDPRVAQIALRLSR